MDTRNDDNNKAFEYVSNLCESGKIVNNEEIEKLFRSIDDVDFTLIKSTEEDDARDPQVVAQEEITPTEAPPESLKHSGVTKSKSMSKHSSAVWQYFEREINNTARCTICNKVYKHCGNTSNLLQHLNGRHALFCSQAVRLKQKQKARVTSESSDDRDDLDGPPPKQVKFKPQKEASDKITNAILYMIAADKMPLSIVQNDGFQWVIKTLAPLYTMPSRKTVTRLIDVRYEVLKNRFISTLKEVDSYSITCDNWTDVGNQSYLGVTIHYVTKQIEMKNGCIGVFPMSENHTSQYLRECLNSVVEDFNLDQSKIMAVVTDKAANIKKAVRDFMGQDKHVACFAHTLSHLVPDVLVAMPIVRDTIAKVKAIVTVTKRSVVASDELKKLQMRDGKTEGTALKFIQDVPTRWNSTLYMLERFVALEEYVYPVMSKCPSAPDMLKREEMQMLNDVISLMKPVERVITEVSGDSYPTCSVIIPLVRCLKVAVRECNPLTRCGIEFKEKLEKAINIRFKDFELHKILAISNILDPRFKKIHFESALAASSAISQINDYIQKDTVQKTYNKESVESIVKTDVWSFHDHLVANKADYSTHSEDISFEIRQYLSQPVIRRQENPLKYWSSMKLAFPSLYKLALNYVSIIGTSVPSERLFSEAGNIKTDNRSRLSGEHLNKLLFLSSLSREDWSCLE
ncbi:zinc finger BED domain-containing protein 4-like [Solenopsis invicta]|uniref:zinc finger BED domain-containing protein 4-like n=1 Tax=Solenopsis invicta TaxID=13686 RepID=UPI00193DA4D0|nr:zinc finger BED domain-containing protein 4-like [Solenopsis invicta]